MRGAVNLSRLQSRGRASETTYFNTQQKDAAQKIRAQLSPIELQKLRSKPPATTQNPVPTIDNLSEISAHSTYERIIHDAQATSTQLSHAGILKAWKDPRTSPPLPTKRVTKEAMLDPSLMRALGQSRYSVAAEHMKQMKKDSIDIKGDNNMGDGVILGAGAFGIASGIVASVGIAGLGYLYLHQEVIDVFRDRSIRLRGTLDNVFGKRLRKFSDGMKERGSLVSKETAESARGIARSSIGIHSAGK